MLAQPLKSRVEPRLLAFRIAVGASLLVVAVIATLDWAAAAARDNYPELALRSRAIDSQAQAQLASRMQLRPEPSEDPAEARRLAVNALARDPTHAQAVRSIGFLDLQGGNIARAARAVDFTHRMTRRDVAAELWLIEYNVQLGRVRPALTHFDAALSTSSEIQTTLLPVLAGAGSDSRLIPALADFLATRRWWLPRALLYLAEGPANAASSVTPSSATAHAEAATNVVILFEILARRGLTFQPRTRDALLARIAPDQAQLIARVRALPVLGDAAQPA